MVVVFMTLPVEGAQQIQVVRQVAQVKEVRDLKEGLRVEEVRIL